MTTIVRSHSTSWRQQRRTLDWLHRKIHSRMLGFWNDGIGREKNQQERWSVGKVGQQGDRRIGEAKMGMGEKGKVERFEGGKGKVGGFGEGGEKFKRFPLPKWKHLAHHKVWHRWYSNRYSKLHYNKHNQCEIIPIANSLTNFFKWLVSNDFCQWCNVWYWIPAEWQ